MEEKAASQSQQDSIHEEHGAKHEEKREEKAADPGLAQDTAKAYKVVPVCALCKKIPEQGLRGGFFLKGIFICKSCENELITSTPENQSEYKGAIAKLKKILFKQKP